MLCFYFFQAPRLVGELFARLIGSGVASLTGVLRAVLDVPPIEESEEEPPSPEMGDGMDGKRARLREYPASHMNAEPPLVSAGYGLAFVYGIMGRSV